LMDLSDFLLADCRGDLSDMILRRMFRRDRIRLIGLAWPSQAVSARSHRENLR
jgi:hypothetical protein